MINKQQSAVLFKKKKVKKNELTQEKMYYILFNSFINNFRSNMIYEFNSQIHQEKLLEVSTRALNYVHFQSTDPFWKPIGKSNPNQVLSQLKKAGLIVDLNPHPHWKPILNALNNKDIKPKEINYPIILVSNRQDPLVMKATGPFSDKPHLTLFVMMDSTGWIYSILKSTGHEPEYPNRKHKSQKKPEYAVPQNFIGKKARLVNPEGDENQMNLARELIQKSL